MVTKSDSKTILVTFAGRRDRMELLTRYVDRAIQQGLIDEWHVWDFSRNGTDAQWLRTQFPVTQTTPSQGVEYFAWPHPFQLGETQERLRFDVVASHDVHIGLRRVGGTGQSYEIIVGGWKNEATAIRAFDDSTHLLLPGLRDPQVEPVATNLTHDVLREFGSTSIALDFGPNGLGVSVEGNELLRYPEALAPGSFEILYRTGFGANGEWLFPGSHTAAARLFVSGPAPHYAPDAMFYTRAYQYYGANRERYKNDVFLKCDDDIVYFDLDALAEFIAFRRRHAEYFLVSANVVNNGVCAHFQQASGAIPADFDQFEMPSGGMCGSLWADGEKAERLHQLFLNDRGRFAEPQNMIIPWKERISINFVAWLGEDLVHIPDIMSDDEHDLCYGVRMRARKINCIYRGFIASHLSFWKQEEAMNVPAVLAGYHALAKEALETGSSAIGLCERSAA